jgi:hypothetical protein
MALLEAQASALPVVAGASGGVAGIVASGETGLLVPPGDAAEFAAAVRRLIVNNDVRAAMAAAASGNIALIVEGSRREFLLIDVADGRESEFLDPSVLNLFIASLRRFDIGSECYVSTAL